jgi:hypothetical protein
MVSEAIGGMIARRRWRTRRSELGDDRLGERFGGGALLDVVEEHREHGGDGALPYEGPVVLLRAEGAVPRPGDVGRVLVGAASGVVEVLAVLGRELDDQPAPVAFVGALGLAR